MVGDGRARAAVCVALVAMMAVSVTAQPPSAELTGFATLPPDTFAAGPPSGRVLSPAGRGAGFASQPVQGCSSIRPERGRPGWWLVLCDNGYGIRANSADFLLRIYSVKPGWRSAAGGGGGVEVGRLIQLSDPDRFVPFRLVREDTPERRLTGGDFDPESFVEAPGGTFWIGDEFGPYLLQVEASGRLLAPPFAADGLRSPDHAAVPVPDAGAASAATVRRSRGFEGLAIDADGSRLVALLESGPLGDAPDSARLIDNADPLSLSELGPLFTFPFITPEAVWPEDARTLVLVNDNNYPGGGGRGLGGSTDASEFIRLTLPRPLPRSARRACGWGRLNRNQPGAP